ncbi:phosphoinositide-3-kinase-interacting protein 1 isoform X1 [Physeter macrocephalus]|uniref:Phosphoinositide-3-kinase-interacting protein 1 isoform X1 n=1 Tax=Physeter macrocephalus TaxID=9755 RepID=A0A455AKK9_PHYMC|nr:phosphoinositide-3-kinase-interacting protein 1 isoform X1 [Physeter catodon]|eukprot:XP_028336378.1 phosphoinositide-3-kinase-interacting protein 1 isoform X1 [Physeter catodon]
MGAGSPARHSVSCPGDSSSSQAASGTTATCTGRTSPLPRRASSASTGWTRRAARYLPPSRVSDCPGRRASGGRAGGGCVPAPAHDAFFPLPGAGNHSYCRNPDQDPRGPWCYVSGEAGAPEKRPCKDLGCPETTFQGPPTSTTETEEVSEVPGGDEVQVFAPANTLPAQSEAAAVQPVIGISQRVRVNSKEKKDLGTLGYVLGVTMMVIIIGIGAGIVLGYTYKRSVASLLGSLREERKVHKVKADSSVAFLPIKEVRCWKRKTSSRCRDLVLVFTR